MHKKVAIIISPNYKDYAKKYLAECAQSIKSQNYAGGMKIFIADNESTEESFGYLKSVFEKIQPRPPASQARALRAGLVPPYQGGEAKISLTPFDKGGEYEIVRNKNNDGFAKGNNDCIKLAMAQGFDYIALFNMDTVLERDCVSKMVETVETKIPLTPFDKGGNTIGAVQARLMLYDDPSTSSGQVKINSLGNVTHFLGFGYARGYGEKYNPPQPPLVRGGVEIAYPSGAAVLFTKEALEKVGLFDEEFWMYNEDQDLGWRLWLQGYSCVLASEAVAYHKYEFSRSVKKYYFMDRNRIIAILKNYRLATLILIFPAFLVMEIGLIFFSLKNGWFKEKIKVYKYFLSLKNWQYILRERKKIQNRRVVSDREVIKLFSGKIWYQEINSKSLAIANLIFNIYWQFVKRLIFW